MSAVANSKVISKVVSESKRNFGDDEGNLPNSKGGSLEKAGVQAGGYIDKKGTPSGLTAFFNMLPPGMNIEDQKVADVSRDLPMKNYSGGLSYPGDGAF